MKKNLIKIITALSLMFFLMAPSIASGATSGNNGTIKIHDGNTESEHNVANQPHVCTFHIHAFFFDAGQVLHYNISQQPPTGHSNVATGSITTDANGEGRTSVMSLPDGHYKLNTDTGNGKPTKDKHKVFWVDCGPVGTTTTTTAPTTTTTGSTTTTSTTVGTTTTTSPRTTTTTVPRTTTTTASNTTTTSDNRSILPFITPPVTTPPATTIPAPTQSNQIPNTGFIASIIVVLGLIAIALGYVAFRFSRPVT